MSRESVLLCPSGLEVRFRSIKGKDLDGLRDKRLLATGEAICNLLDNCTLEVLQRAIYERLPQFKWADAIIGDQMAAWIGLRRATIGDEFGFRVRCSDRDCRKMIDWKLDLNDLETKALPIDSARIYVEGNLFETTFLDRKVTFRLRNGHDQAKFARAISRIKPKKGDSEVRTKSLLGLALRIVDIDGVAEQDKLDFLEDQYLVDLKALRDKLDEADCGVDTTVEVVCQECDLTQEVELPLDGTFFKSQMT